ncbi:MAG: TonB-dependent receptor plug domain-containing protein, partial [Bacteroidota bacterium]
MANRKEQMIQASAGISQVAINPAQIKAVPSLGEKDIFRSLQLLPGVSGSNESSSGLFVRGGTPDQNLVLFDGFTVYHVDHLFGFFSAFNSNAVKDVQLFKGGFEAKYGGRLSSVVDITGKDGNSETFNVGAGLSAVAANAFAEVPFAKGKGTIILTGRHSFQSNFYKDLLEFSDGDDETGTEENAEEEETPAGPFGGRRGFNTAEPNSWFYDFNAKTTYRAGQNVFSLSLYGGKDKLDNSRFTDRSSLTGGFNPFGGGSTEEDFNFSIDVLDKSDWGNTGGSLKWSRRWSDKLYSNALISRSNYFSFRDRGNSTLIERDTIRTEINAKTVEDNDLVDYSLRWDWEWQPNPVHKIGFGVFGSALDIKYDFIQDDTTTVLARDDQGIVAGAYLQSKSTLSDKLIIVPGVRFSYFDQTGEPYFEPRLQLQYLPSSRLKVKAATGRFYQFANRILREDVSQGSRDFWILSDAENVPVGASTHFILGTAYETDGWLF